MRFAGTWKQYSKKAIPQLARITFQSASLRYFRWPYHAKVMKMLEIVSNRIVRIRKGAPCTVLRFRLDLRREGIHRSCCFVKCLVPDSTRRLFRPVPCSSLPEVLEKATHSLSSFRFAPNPRHPGRP